MTRSKWKEHSKETTRRPTFLQECGQGLPTWLFWSARYRTTMGSKYFEKAYGIAGRFSWQNKAMWGTCSISSALTVGSVKTTGRWVDASSPHGVLARWAVRRAPRRAPDSPPGIVSAQGTHSAPRCSSQSPKVTPIRLLSSEPAWSLWSLLWELDLSTWIQVNCRWHHPQTALSEPPEQAIRPGS